MEIEGDQELSSGRKAKAARTEKLPPAVEGKAEGVSSPSAPDKVKALFTGAVMTPELAPKSTLQEERNLCPQSGLSPPGVNMNTPWWEGAGAPHPSQKVLLRKRVGSRGGAAARRRGRAVEAR